MRMPEPASPLLSPGRSSFASLILRKCASCEEEDKISRKAEASLGVAGVSASIPTSGGNPLPASERAFFEPRFGYDFSKVRVHADSSAAQSAQSLNAAAYTVKNRIVFGPGRYQPRTVEGRRLLAHELTHVIQQEEHPRVMPAQAEPSRSYSTQDASERLTLALTRARTAVYDRRLPRERRALIARQIRRLSPLLSQLRNPNTPVQFHFDATPSQNEIIPGDSQRSIQELYGDVPSGPATHLPERNDLVQAKALPGGLQITPLSSSKVQRFCDPFVCVGLLILGGLLYSGCRDSAPPEPSQPAPSTPAPSTPTPNPPTQPRPQQPQTPPSSSRTMCSDYPGYDSSRNERSYNCAGLATRTYLNLNTVPMATQMIGARFTNPREVSAGVRCGGGEVRFWLWRFGVVEVDDLGQTVDAYPDFHMVAGKADAAGNDPTSVYSKDGFRRVRGPAAPMSFRPLARERTTYSEPLEREAFTRAGRPMFWVRSNMTETFICAGCYT